MSSKTPSSLLWMIRKQTRLVGLMERRSAELARLKARIAEIKAELGVLAVQRSQIYPPPRFDYSNSFLISAIGQNSFIG